MSVVMKYITIRTPDARLRVPAYVIDAIIAEALDPEDIHNG